MSETEFHDLVRGISGDVPSVEANATRDWLDHSGDSSERRRFTGSVAADQGDNGSFSNLE